jgi:hypothetical protein
MLTDIIPAKYRKVVYGLYAVAVVVAGALAVAGVDTGKTNDVLAYLGGALGVVAAANTAPKAAGGEDGNADASLLLNILTFVGVVLLLFGVSFR